MVAAMAATAATTAATTVTTMEASMAHLLFPEANSTPAREVRLVARMARVQSSCGPAVRQILLTLVVGVKAGQGHGHLAPAGC